MIDLRYLKKLIEIIDGSTLDSLEISSDKGMRIRISKTPQQRTSVQVAAPVSMPALLSPDMPAPRTSLPQGMPAVVEPEAPAAAAEARKGNLLEVKSPMVGTFYQASEPGSRPYVSVGDRVSKGQVLCIIEAMKIMNEIESEYSGLVREILVQDAQPVEYGQVLFRIDANG
jgi:acetyl-CoA carboxylase biotin carboxyl carrier protein